MKKILAFSLSLLLLCIPGCKSERDEDGELYAQPLYYIESDIFGYYAYENHVEIADYLGDTTEELLIPEYLYDSYEETDKPVKVIGRSAFRGEDELKIISIPDTVVKIRSAAFAKCTRLESLEIGSSVEEIGASAFYGTAMRNIVIPDSVKNIESRAFADCTYLKTVNLGQGVEKLRSEAFSGCTALYEVTGGASLKVVDDNAFESTPWLMDKTDEFVMLENVLLKYNGSDSNAEVPKGTVGISSAFAGNTQVSHVVLPSSLEYIGEKAFYGCSVLAEINTENIVYAGCDAFEGTPYFDAIETDSNGFGIIGKGVLVKYTGDSENVIIPKSVVCISDAFENNKNILSLTLGENAEIIGTDAFLGCDFLAKVKMSDSVSYIDDSAFDECPITEFDAGSNAYAKKWAENYGLSNII